MKQTLITKTIFCDLPREKPCPVGPKNFVIMDKFVTFMGFLQNFVVPSRRNQSSKRGNASSETRNHNKKEAYLPPKKSHSRVRLL